ncbi:hypothetical protein TCDM_10732 [Trypanosoma cruzi Dm28c]|uniref:Uncharacterized protein n=1 Tax=Trypanosoma cruzi Dm28c TaxID=1416333 RepID=V5B278_TRYCR|nr:hypothetical protein TCDM_10732 [Trypanosoma cruzi Dm28c]
MIFTVLDTSPDSRPAAVGDGPAPAFLPFSAPDPLLGDPELPISLRGTSGTRDGEMAATAALTSVCSVGSAAHTDGQQHRASTSRAHSRRHVIIIVSVVIQWCGADLHSEGHGEQQGRREMRQTHTEGTPHEERAAARHTPHTTHDTQMEEGEENGSGTQGSTACTYGESGPSCLHPSRRVRTHKKVQRTQQHKGKVTITIKKE